jgi:hypothetical protein
MRSEDHVSGVALVRVVLWYVAKVVGLVGVFSIIAAFYTLVGNDGLKYRFIDFVVLLVVGALLLASGIWMKKKGKRLE